VHARVTDYEQLNSNFNVVLPADSHMEDGEEAWRIALWYL